MSFNKNFFFFIAFAFIFAFLNLIIVACGGSGGGDNQSDSNSELDSPPPPPSTGTGSIQGTVRSSNGTLLNAVHVRVVKVDELNIQIGAFSGIGPDLTFQDGVFRIDGAPPGNYRILIEKLDGRSAVFDDFRYSKYVVSNSPSTSFPDEYFNGERESSADDPFDFIEIAVVDGETTQDITFITND